MKAFKIVLKDLENKAVIRLCSENGKFNFKNSALMVEIRFDNPSRTVYKFSADGWVGGQKNTDVIEVRIPDGASKAHVALASIWGTDNLKDILVQVDDRQERMAS